MSGIRVALASLRPPKLRGLTAALQSCSPWLSAQPSFAVRGFEVASGVSSTPLSRTETMLGAFQRVQALGQRDAGCGEAWDFFVGLEGGLEILAVHGKRTVFLESWAYVANAAGEGHFGQSGAIELPSALSERVVEGRQELSDAIDAYAGRAGIRNGQGAWGILTAGLVSREEAFRIAAINAFAPFFDRERMVLRSW